MASIDKIYGTIEQYYALYGFCKLKNKKLRFYNEPFLIPMINDDSIFAIVNTSTEDDYWLAKNCPFKFVLDRLFEVYDVKNLDELLVKLKEVKK